MTRFAVAVLLALAPWTVDARADELYVSNTHSGTVSVIDAAKDEVVATIPLGGGVPNRLVLTPDGAQAWAIHDKSRVISIVDVAARKVLRKVKIGEWPYNLTFTPDGRYCWVLDWGDVSKFLGTKAYVSNRHANVVTVIGLADHREIKRIPVDKGPHGMALSPASRP